MGGFPAHLTLPRLPLPPSGQGALQRVGAEGCHLPSGAVAEQPAMFAGVE